MDNRTAILDSALSLFAERGYDGVGVQEVAENAGITKPTLYHYFGSKQGLLEALVEMHHAPLTAAVHEAAQYSGNLPMTLERLGRCFFECARRDPVYYRLQLSFYFAAPGSDPHRVIAARSEEQHSAVEAMFLAAQRDHGNTVGRQRLYAATFVGTLNTCIGLWLNGYAALDDDLLRRAVKQFQHGIYS
jgi:AcrR family transcriptional regulator